MMASRNAGTATRPARSDDWTVREADGEADAFYIMRLWHHWFGGRYESQTSLQPDLFDVAGWTLPDDADDAPLKSYGVIAEHDPADREATVRVGGGLVSLLDHDAAAAELPSGAFDPDALAGDRNAWFVLGVVDGAWRGRGIGRELFARRQEWAVEEDADMALACGWERRDGPTSRPLFEAFGWVPVQRVESMYAETGRTACPDCGVWPSDDRLCHCDATVWASDLPGGGV